MTPFPSGRPWARPSGRPWAQGSRTQPRERAARPEPASEVDPREGRRYTGAHKKTRPLGLLPATGFGAEDLSSQAPGHQAGWTEGRSTVAVSFSGRAAQTRPSPAKANTNP